MDNKRFSNFLIVFFSVVLSALAKEKPLQQEKATSLTMMQQYIDLSNLEVVDYLRFVALILAFIAVVFYNCGGIGFRKGIDLAIFVHGFVAFFFPRTLLSVLTPMKIDVAHEFMVQNIGIVMIGIVWANVYASHSDQREGAIILTRFLTLLGMIVADLTVYFGGQIKFNQQHLMFGIFYAVLMCIGHLYYIYQRGDFGRHTTQYSLNSGLNIHLMVDLVIMTTGCVTDMAYSESFSDFIAIPGWKIDPFHLHIVKVGAMMEFSMVLYSVLALSFADDRDKRNVFVMRFIMLSMSTVTMMLYQFKHGLFTRNGFIMFVVFTGVMFVNTLWALYGNPAVALSNIGSPQMVLRRKKVT